MQPSRSSLRIRIRVFWGCKAVLTYHIFESENESCPAFKKESLDLVWAEGSIAHIGFERGVNEWRALLKTGGYIAVTDATWFTDARRQFLKNHAGVKAAEELMRFQQHEAELYAQYKQYYGYVFYIGKK